MTHFTKTIRNISLILAFVLGSFSVNKAQNLVPNPSFEQLVSTCAPGTAIGGKVASWAKPPKCTGAAYNLSGCKVSAWGTPQNKIGYEPAKTGGAYLGVITYKAGTAVYRSYIQTTLTQPLTAGHTYYAEMYVSLSDSSWFASNGLGMYFSVDTVKSTLNTLGRGNALNLLYTPQVVMNSVLTSGNGWIRISGTFVATGGERFLTIGNFGDNLHTLFQPVRTTVTTTAKNKAIYYIDDVNVSEVIVTTPPPVANFSLSTTNGRAPLTVTYTSMSTGNPTSYSWSVDGVVSGTNSTLSNTFPITAAGTHSIALTVKNAGGSNSITKTVTVLMPKAGTAFSATPVTGSAPLTVVFSNTTSTNGYQTNYIWNFGDGSSFTGQNPPSHVYTSIGNYAVTLTASNADGDSILTKTSYIQVTGTLPVADFTIVPANTANPFIVVFKDLSTNGGSNSWDFGDGRTDAIFTGIPHCYMHTYSSLLAVYTVSMTETNANGSNTKTKPNFVTFGPSFTGNKIGGGINTAITFTNTTAAAVMTGYTTSCVWDFGDGSPTSTQASPTHTYTRIGDYSVTLTVIGSKGSISTTKAAYISIGIPRTYYSRAAGGGWSSPLTWSTVSYTSSSNSGTFPKIFDTVNVASAVTIDDDSISVGCQQLNMTKGSLIMTSGGIMSITGDININHSAAGVLTLQASAQSIINVGGKLNVTATAGSTNVYAGAPGALGDEGTISFNGPLKANLTGAVGNTNFSAYNYGELDFGITGGASTITHNSSSATSTVTLSAADPADNGGATMSMGGDSLVVNQIAGGNISISGNDDGEVDLPGVTINNTGNTVTGLGAKDVGLKANDNSSITVSGDLKLNLSGPTGSTINLFQNANLSGDVAGCAITGDLKINQTGGDSVNIVINGDGNGNGAIEVDKNLYMARSAGKTLKISLFNKGDFNVQAASLVNSTPLTGKISMIATKEASFSVAGDLNLNSAQGINLSFDLNAGLNLGSTLTRPNLATGFISFGTSGFMNISGTGVNQVVPCIPGINYPFLTLTNTNGVTLEGNTTVLTELDINTKVNLNGFNLSLGTSSYSGDLLNNSSGWVYGNGQLTRWFSSTTAILQGDVAGLFPVGTTTDYRPLSFVKTSGTGTGGQISVQHFGNTGWNALTAATAFQDVDHVYINFVNNSYWSVSKGTTPPTAGTWGIDATPTPGTFADYTKLRLSKVSSSANGTTLAGTSTIVSRRGLSVANLFYAATGGSNYYIASTNPIGAPSAKMASPVIETKEETNAMNSLQVYSSEESVVLNLIGLEDQSAIVQVIDINGKLISTQSASIIEGNNLVKVSMSGMAKGVYLVKMTSMKASVSKKFFW